MEKPDKRNQVIGFIKGDLWVILLDIIAVNISHFLALLIRFFVGGKFYLTLRTLPYIYSKFAPFYTIFCLLVFFFFKLYGGMWRYAGLNDINRIAGASVVTFIAEKEGLSPSEMDTLLNKKSGFLGISGISSDDRDVSAAAEAGNERAKLAIDMLEYQILKYIGSYVAVLGGVDAIVFTAGIGENQYSHRETVCHKLGYIGVEIDDEVNKKAIRGVEGKISTENSKVDVFVIPTNEEIVIARDTAALVNA